MPWLSSQSRQEGAVLHKAFPSPVQGFTVVPAWLIFSLPHADPIIRLLERAVPGLASQGVLPGDHE